MVRQRVLPPINSIKHMFGHTQFSVPSASVTNNQEIESVSLPAVANANEVRAGAVIKAVYIEYWIVSDSVNSTATFNITVEKRSGGQPSMTFTNANNLTAYPNKKNILYTTQGIVGNNGQNNAVPIVKQWVPIPKGKQRFGLGDTLFVNFAAITTGLQVCGISIYKEYF